MGTSKRGDHIALYGAVGIVRRMCPDCRRMALVLRGRFQCCDRAVEDAIVSEYVRFSSPTFVRRGPSVKARERLIRQQDNSCAWCFRRFGSQVWMRGKPRAIQIRWDHVLPHAFNQNNHDDNFVASCQYCNSWKADMVFENTDQVRLYVAKKWASHEPEVVRSVREEVRDG